MKYSYIEFFLNLTMYQPVYFSDYDDIFNLHQNILNKIKKLTTGKETFGYRKEINIYSLESTQVSTIKQACRITLFGHHIDKLKNLKKLNMQNTNKIFYHIGILHEIKINKSYGDEYIFCCDVMRGELKNKKILINIIL